MWEASGACSHTGVHKGNQQGVRALKRDPHHQKRRGCANDGKSKGSASWSVLSKTQTSGGLDTGVRNQLLGSLKSEDSRAKF